MRVSSPNAHSPVIFSICNLIFASAQLTINAQDPLNLQIAHDEPNIKLKYRTTRNSNMSFWRSQPENDIIPPATTVYTTPEHPGLKISVINSRLNCSFSKPVRWTFRFYQDKNEWKTFKMESGRRWKRMSNGSLERGKWYSSLKFKYILPSSLEFTCHRLHNPFIRITVMLKTEGSRYVIQRVADLEDPPLQDRSSACPQTIKVSYEEFRRHGSFQWYCENQNKVVNTKTSELFCSDPLSCANFFPTARQNDACLERLDPDDFCEHCRTYPIPEEGEYAPRYLHCGEIYQYAFFSYHGRYIYFKLNEADPEEMMELNITPADIYRHNSTSLKIECEISNFYFGRGAIISLHFENDTLMQFEDSGATSRYNNFRKLSENIPATDLKVGSIVVNCFAPIIFNGTWHVTSKIIRVIEPEIPNFVDETSPNIKQLRTGDSVTLDCHAKGIPKPKIQWIFPIPLLNYTISADMVAVVEISDVKSYHNGVYKCLAQNKFGKAEKSFEIEVSEDSTNLTSNTYLITLGSVGVTVLLSVSLVLLFYIKRYRKIRSLVKFLTDEEVHSFFNGIPGNEEVDAIMPSTCIPYTSEYEIPLENIILGEHILGSGEFGLVYKGSVENSSMPPSLAIKTMKNNIDVGLFKSVLSEIKVMIYLGNHENIAKFFGACTSNIQKGEVYIAIELCEHGNLLKFLRTNRQFFVESYESGQMETAFQNMYHRVDDPSYKNLSFQLQCTDLIRWAMEIANGMTYLKEKNVIHGDIAARNVLLSSKLTAKISDFGLSRQLTNYTSYIKTSQCALPWRWMALESLRDMTFSIHSDVWAYAITIWEIFSLGEIPYPGLNWNVDFVGKLDNGLRLLKPEYASDQIYEEMLNCWLKVPNRRPTFEHLRRFFQLQYE